MVVDALEINSNRTQSTSLWHTQLNEHSFRPEKKNHFIVSESSNFGFMFSVSVCECIQATGLFEMSVHYCSVYYVYVPNVTSSRSVLWSHISALSLVHLKIASICYRMILFRSYSEDEYLRKMHSIARSLKNATHKKFSPVFGKCHSRTTIDKRQI